MNSYLDASLLVAIVAEDTHSAAAHRWWRASEGQRIIGRLTGLEVAATVSRGVRTGRFSNTVALEILSDYDSLTAFCLVRHLADEDFIVADAVMRDFVTKLAAADALHLASALAARATLVTFDARLADAARLVGAAVIMPA